MTVASLTTPLRQSRHAGYFLVIVSLLASCADHDLHRNRYVKVSTVAGNGTPGLEDGGGALAKFNYPCGLALDEAGNLFVADYANHSIRKITPDGMVSTFAGTGAAGSNDGDRLQATFNNPYGLALDGAGNMYVGDAGNNRIRKIAPDGMVTTLAGKRKGFSDGQGALAMFNNPNGVAVDAGNNVYVADSYNNRIRKIAPDGSVSTIAGNGNDGFVDGSASEAEFYVPIGIVVDPEGSVYVGDEGNSSIRKITGDGQVTTLAGNGKFSFCDGVGKNAEFNAPGAIAMDSAGNLYVADYLNNCIRMVSPSGAVHKIAGNLRKGFADGAPAEAEFHYPYGVAIDRRGAVYVGDHYNHRIRRIN